MLGIEDLQTMLDGNSVIFEVQFEDNNWFIGLGKNSEFGKIHVKIGDIGVDFSYVEFKYIDSDFLLQEYIDRMINLEFKGNFQDVFLSLETQVKQQIDDRENLQARIIDLCTNEITKLGPIEIINFQMDSSLGIDNQIFIEVETEHKLYGYYYDTQSDSITPY